MYPYADLQGSLRADLSFALDGVASLSSDTSIDAAYALLLTESFYKKLLPEGVSTDPDRKALKKFLAINEKCPTGTFRFPARDEAESCFYDYLKNNLNSALQSHLVFDQEDYDGPAPYDLNFIREHMDVGPGASQLADASTMCTKLFTGPMSYSGNDFLITVYRAALVETGLWADAEMLRFQKFGFTEVRGGKVFFAKKNSEISRTCCTEANLNMLVQKSCGAFLESRLQSCFDLNLGNQADRNKEMARLGSIDGSYGTIDLVSASDSISLSLVDDLLEPSFLKTMIMQSRSRSAILPDGSEVVLNMISTMGNGFTFPLQTIIFASAVRAVYQLMDLPCYDSRSHYGVFGDDIVVHKQAYVFLCRMLTMLGFEVNEGKSFNTGPFRESCGGDYFSGVNVRGVYLRSLETPQQVASAFNRLTRWQARSGISLNRTLKALREVARGMKIPLVPYSESDDAGLKVPFRLSVPRLDNSYWFRYRYLAKRVSKLVMPEPDDSPNPPGFGLSFLSGHTRRSDCAELLCPVRFNSAPVRISLRDPPQAVGRHKVRQRAIPFWDWHGVGEGGDPLSHAAWESSMMASDLF